MTSEINRPISQVLQDVVGNIQEIIRSEFHLAKAEMKVEGAKAAKGATVIAAGGVLGLYAGGFLLLSIVYALSTFLAPWQAALLVAVIVGLGAAILISAGRSKLKKVHPAPQRTIENVKENIAWAEKH
jgi:hypothetical protein